MANLNSLLIKKFIHSSGQAEIDALCMNVVYKSSYWDDANKWVNEHNEDGKEYMMCYNEKHSMTYVYETPNLTDGEIAALSTFVSNKSLLDICTKVNEIHFWVKFWSILGIIGTVITIIALLAML